MARRLLSLLLFSSVFASITASTTAVQAQRGIPINIESVPPGATVHVDSTASPALGQTPLRSVRIPSGEHTFIFQLANHEEARLQVTVRRRRETFRAVLRALGTIEVIAGNDNARGGRVAVDGRQIQGSLGTTNIRVTDLQPGRHQVRVEREGYRSFETWVEVGGGQLAQVTAILERAAPDTGQILVSGPTGAPIFLDGTPSGTVPTVLENVAVGPHTVEIRAPGQRPFTQQVVVIAGQRATVALTSAGGGTLRVIASAPGVTISVDGEPVGPSPAIREGLAPGEHIVEGRAEGYEPARQTVAIEDGQQRVVSLEMTRLQGAAGRIVVQANVAGASVLVDGEERGVTPVVLTPEPGPHAIAVRAEGHQDYTTTCETAPGRNCEINANLVPQQVRVRIAVQPGIRGAELLVDDVVRGPVPFDGTLPAGSHILTVRAPGYEEVRQQVLLTPSSGVQPFDMVLPTITDGLTETERQQLYEETERLRSAAVTHSAGPLPVNQATLDLSIGWPYLGELRLSVGLLEWLDAGFAIRSFGRLTEFEGRVRLGYRALQQLAIALQTRFGGGIGPNFGYIEGTYPTVPCMDGDTNCMPGQTERQALASERYNIRPDTDGMPGEPDPRQFSFPVNSAFLSIEALGSLHFSDQGAFTLWLGLDLSSDEYAGHPLNSAAFLTHDPDGEPYCTMSSTDTITCPREDFARARLGGSLELVLTRNWNLWFMLEGILSAQPRRILGNLIGIQTNDTQFYFRIGVTYKF